MRIVSVHLKNIKSHRDTELSFSPGINVLSGANGSGKSTIFQAIGYALFGVSAQDFVSRAERFLTIGTKRGEISVVFEPAEGELYRVTRTVGAAGKWLLAKGCGGVFEVEEHANIQETELRIATLLGLSGARPLAEQFKLVIGPFQNDFLGPFVIRQPTKRQDAFDEILGIDAWRKTFDGTKTLASTILAKMDTLQAEAAGKMEQVAVLPAKELELSGLKGISAAKRAELELRLADLERMTALVSGLDAQKERIDSAQSAVQGLEERVNSGKDHVATQQLLAEQSRNAAAVLAATSKGKKGYDEAEERLKVLRAREQQKLLLERKLAELDKEQSGIGTALAIETRELAELGAGIEADARRLADEEKSVCDELAELKKTEADAGRALAQVNRSGALFRELPIHRIENTMPYLFVALDRMAAIDAQSGERLGLVAGSAALKAQAGELAVRQAELERVQGERSELLGRRLSLIEGREKIDTGDCPFFHEPCKNIEAGGGAEVFSSRIELLDAEILRLDQRAEALALQVASAQGAARELAGVEQVALELEKGGRERQALETEFNRNLSEIAPAVLVSSLDVWLVSTGLTGAVSAGEQRVELHLSEDPRQRRDQISAWSDGWRSVIVSLEQSLAVRVKEAEGPVQGCALRLAELNARGESLQGKKRELAASKERVLQREKTIERHQVRLETVLEAFAAQKAALAVHAGLADAIKGAGEELERFQPDRDAFIANQKAAEELEKRLETLTKYQARLHELDGQLAEKREELKGLLAGYQPQQHESVKKDREVVVSAVATLNAEITGLAEGVARLEGEIVALAAVAEEIAKKLAAIDALKEQGNLVKFLRNQVFKNVSSQLSERFREEISFRADRIYRSISESDEELYWGENYQIVLKDMAEGEIRERTDDQLSGGQMMSAVVALRLALLQTIGARIAFFDEPTSNLDAERRENLAKAFRAIDVGQEEVTEHWYDQLFLVSHDVSFTEITDQTIQLD
ncbi:MAG: DNA repair exonuclease [Geobacteraceae bacterium GWC2_58_44]|nr:MAG: DNA repair exonuclease [Geobacteraceae bacterium GWC2_58_44]